MARGSEGRGGPKRASWGAQGREPPGPGLRAERGVEGLRKQVKGLSQRRRQACLARRTNSRTQSFCPPGGRGI